MSRMTPKIDFIGADDFQMTVCYGTPSFGIHIFHICGTPLVSIAYFMRKITITGNPHHHIIMHKLNLILMILGLLVTLSLCEEHTNLPGGSNEEELPNYFDLADSGLFLQKRRLILCQKKKKTCYCDTRYEEGTKKYYLRCFRG